ncbi:PAS domain-containing sensor histidine kinase [Candidatus Endobugula sertula]|uniref:histidine kinase n=1 Tax=Candidatus Endobugula sertula TaxID=62101 RepID=A0A1D2QU15_9GAMM|nr:PAS domain-containing sensor histidine kinase [Candidatus Endobugula sertula]
MDASKHSLQSLDVSENLNQQHLRSAFETFNELSTRLAESYQFLEAKVDDLTQELSYVNEQKDQELQQKKQLANRLENLVNFLPGGVIVLDHRGLIVDTNPTAEEMLEANLKGKLWRSVIGRCFSPKDDDGHEVSNHQGKRISIATRSLGKDGQIILLTDQTETRRLQAELSRHDRLTALGKMVSTLAHQVRTPLSSAMLYGNHLLNESLTETQQHEFTQKLVNRLQEMERQVSDMLLFVKGRIPLNDVTTIAGLQQLLVESMEMPLQQCWVNCCWHVSDGEREIQCNCDALVGAILNLVNNSLQSMREGGELSITLKQQNHMLYISVQDEGVGMTDKQKQDAHELFYTTKSQGTGIGLSVVNTVAKSHGGTFLLESNHPRGLRAILELPIIRQY